MYEGNRARERKKKWCTERMEQWGAAKLQSLNKDSSSDHSAWVPGSSHPSVTCLRCCCSIHSYQLMLKRKKNGNLNCTIWRKLWQTYRNLRWEDDSKTWNKDPQWPCQCLSVVLISFNICFTVSLARSLTSTTTNDPVISILYIQSAQCFILHMHINWTKQRLSFLYIHLIVPHCTTY